MLLRHGVRSCLEYEKTRDIRKARQLSNPNLSPHLSFVDMGGHGYAVVRASSDQIETEFVCIPRPIERSEEGDGGTLRYRTFHTAKLWPKRTAPVLQTKVVEGNADFSI
jgi:alkaline phosphatase D